MRIQPLADVPDAAPVLEGWFVAEWEPYYGTDGPGDAAADIADSMRTDGLPLALIALDDAGRPLGTAALKTDSPGSELGLGPWLAAVVIAPEHRGQGVGSALIAAIEDETRRQGHASLYTSTDTLTGLLERRGWRAIDSTETLRGRVAVYTLDLGT